MIYVYRDGALVPKPIEGPGVAARASTFPTPMLSPRFDAFESPVTGKEVSSWRSRDRDMADCGAVDPRDLPRAPFEKRERDNARQRSEQWGEPGD